MGASVDKRGFKRVCVECGARFYDLNKRPIICPVCSAEFSVEEKIKPKPPAVEKKAEPKKDDGQVSEETVAEKTEDELEEDEDGVDIVSLDDLETTEAPSEDDDATVNIDLDDDDLDDLDVDLDEAPDLGDDLDENLEKE